MHNFTEMEKILDKNCKHVLLSCINAVHEKYPAAKIILYGSRARGEANLESDLDLLVLFDEDVTSEKKKIIRDLFYEISLAEDLVISTIVRSYSSWNSPISRATPLYNSIQEEGIQVL